MDDTMPFEQNTSDLKINRPPDAIKTREIHRGSNALDENPPSPTHRRPGITHDRIRPAGALHRLLRAATRSDQVTIERLVMRLDLSRREDYGLLSYACYAVLSLTRGHWRPADVTDFAAMSRCLVNDLRHMQITLDSAMPRTPQMTDVEALGMTWVLRGAWRGLPLLRSRVRKTFAASFMEFDPLVSWRDFSQGLGLGPASARIDAECIRGARLTIGVVADILTGVLP